MKIIGFVLLILVICAYDGCGGNHGITITIDGVGHSISWK